MHFHFNYVPNFLGGVSLYLSLCLLSPFFKSSSSSCSFIFIIVFLIKFSLELLRLTKKKIYVIPFKPRRGIIALNYYAKCLVKVQKVDYWQHLLDKPWKSSNFLQCLINQCCDLLTEKT